MASGAGKYDTSAFMAGNIAVSVVFIESNGGLDVSTEDWTTDEISRVVSYIDNACNWWETMWEQRGYVGELNFTLDLKYADSPFQSVYEPITRTVIEEDKLWISEYLNSLGYSGSKNEMLYEYNNDLNSENNADFAFTIFVVKADDDSDHKFPDNYQAYTWGSYANYSKTYVTLAYSDYYDWYTEVPFAHEIAHIFGAADEYPGQGKYTDICGYYGVQNTNAIDGNPNPETIVTSLMNNSLRKAYSQYISSPQSLEMIGWRDSDGDGVIDVLDAPIGIENFSSNLQLADSKYSFSGTFIVQKNQNYDNTKAITINSVDRLIYQYGESEEWISVNTTDWGVDEKNISYEFTLPSDSVLRWKVIDSSGRTESKTYVIGNISNPQALVDYETDTVVLSFSPATVDTGITQYNLSIDNQVYNILSNNELVLSELPFGDHQWKIQGVYANASVTDWFSCESFNLTPKIAVSSMIGNANEVVWRSVRDISNYVLQYSMDNFQTVMTISVSGNSVSSYNLNAGSYQWRVRAVEGTEWSVGNDITSSAPDVSPSRFGALDDGVTDAFFVKPIGTWNRRYGAQHQGVYGGWEGTGEKVVFKGENRFEDIFQGSSDENVLLLTDNENGDALFIDDIYSDSKDNMAIQQARLSNMKEIRAGAGNDIVDLTSQRFDYLGGGMIVRGGLGDDVIWANKGNNTLFGDAGNDRIVGADGNDIIVGGSGDDSMHGGGGKDIFAFGGNWGNDVVEQLTDGMVTLWFEEGSLDHWDAATMTYRDGDKSVAVNGLTADAVTLKFGDDGSAQYGELLKAGAFDEFSSEKIFEDKNRGTLA